MTTAKVFFHDPEGVTMIVMEGDELYDFNEYGRDCGYTINTPTLKMFTARITDTDAEGTTTIIIQVTEGLLPL